MVRRSALGSISVLADGQPVKRRRARTPTYEIPLADGTTKPIELKGVFTGLRAVVDGTEIPLERKLRAYEIVLVFLPFALVLGGLVGGLIGALGFAVNSQVVRSSARAPVKALAMLGTATVAGLIWFGIASALSPAPTLTTGTCLNGIHVGGTLTASSSRAVDCSSPHDNEVIGTFDYPSSPSFPGEPALQDYAANVCIPAFATYVGIDLANSKLDIIPVLPSSDTWPKGDRTISCVVVTTDGTTLTTTVKGSRL